LADKKFDIGGLLPDGSKVKNLSIESPEDPEDKVARLRREFWSFVVKELAAFAVGFVSFISPCVLPLVPGYLSAVSGVTIAELREGDHKASRVLWPAIIFCLSFTFMFVALGMSATGLGQTLNDHRGTFDKIAGGEDGG